MLGGRASTYQILGDHDASIRDYKQAVELDPGEPFIQLLYFVELARAGKADEAKKNFATFAADGRFDDWPRALARFFAGEIDAAAIEKLAAEGETDLERDARAFDRDFYLGQAALIAGNTGDARSVSSAVVATGERQYIEYNIAAADVAKLKGVAQTGTTPPAEHDPELSSTSAIDDSCPRWGRTQASGGRLRFSSELRPMRACRGTSRRPRLRRPSPPGTRRRRS